MKYYLSLSVFISLLLCFCECFQWQDCGTPLTRVVYYESVTLSPSSQIPSVTNTVNPPKLSINVNARLLKPLTNANTVLQVEKDGTQYVSSTIKDLCTILLATSDLSCSNLVVGNIYSVTYNWVVPPLPAGNYTVRIVNVNNQGEVIGCVSAKASVAGLLDRKCSYTSSFNASLSGTATYQVNDVTARDYGQWIQVGPWGSNAGGQYIDWGKVERFYGTADITGGNHDASNFTWGINGTLTKIENVENTILHTYNGNFIVGYQRGPSTYDYIVSGFITFTFSYPSANPNNGGSLSKGMLTVNPMYNYPYGFEYPLILGNLNPFSVAPDETQTLFVVRGDRTWCSCGYDKCGVCGGDGSVCSLTAEDSDSGLSNVDIGAIVIAVVGFIGLIIVIIFGISHVKAAGKRIHYDESDLMYPQKPDYGSMSLNEILEDGEQPLI